MMTEDFTTKGSAMTSAIELSLLAESIGLRFLTRNQETQSVNATAYPMTHTF